MRDSTHSPHPTPPHPLPPHPNPPPPHPTPPRPTPTTPAPHPSPPTLHPSPPCPSAATPHPTNTPPHPTPPHPNQLHCTLLRLQSTTDSLCHLLRFLKTQPRLTRAGWSGVGGEGWGRVGCGWGGGGGDDGGWAGKVSGCLPPSYGHAHILGAGYTPVRWLCCQTMTEHARLYALGSHNVLSQFGTKSE